MRVPFLALLFGLNFWNLSYCQSTNPGPGGGGSGPNQSGISVVALPAAELPMGEKVTLELKDYDGGNIAWFASCADPFGSANEVNNGECDCAGGEAGPFPATETIWDSPRTAGDWLYKAYVTKDGITQNASIAVKFRAPNSSVTTIGNLEVFYAPQQGGPLQRNRQTMETVLKWDNKPLGPCAAICAKEKVKIFVNSNYKEELKNLRFEQKEWIPTPCFSNEHFGDPQNPNEWTLKWISPTLYDKNWIYWNYEQWQFIQTLPAGTVLAKRHHRYLIEGTGCNGVNWDLKINIWFEYFTRPVKRPDGTLYNPPSYVGEWRVIGN